MAGLSRETVLRAKRNIGKAFGVDETDVTFDATGTDRAIVGGLSGASFGQDKKFALEGAVDAAFRGAPKADITGAGQLKSITFTHGDLDGTVNAIASADASSLEALKKALSSMKTRQGRDDV
jgi:hypothetical protein